MLVETEATSENSDLMNQLAAISGMSVTRSGSDVLAPDMYIEILKSTPFLVEVLEQQVTDPESGESITVGQYIELHPPTTLGSRLKDYTMGLPGKIINLFRGKKESTNGLPEEIVTFPLTDSILFSATITQLRNAGMLRRIITGEVVPKSYKLIISVENSNPKITVQLAGSVVQSLTRYITENRTRKVKTDLVFITGLCDEAEVNYKRAQQRLASYRDRNQNIILATNRTEEDRLKSEFDLAFDLFQSVSQLREQAKIKVQEKTPAFTIIEPVIGASKSKPKTDKILILMIFLGTLVGVGIVFGKPIVQKFKEHV